MRASGLVQPEEVSTSLLGPGMSLLGSKDLPAAPAWRSGRVKYVGSAGPFPA